MADDGTLRYFHQVRFGRGPSNPRLSSSCLVAARALYSSASLCLNKGLGGIPHVGRQRDTLPFVLVFFAAILFQVLFCIDAKGLEKTFQ